MNALHRDYELASLDESSVGSDPLALLQEWLDTASRHSGMPEPTAMALATVDATGHPANRVVLLRGLDARGLAFFTNYESRKGRHLDTCPVAAALFFWPLLERQVRVEGAVERLPGEESDNYFSQRPRASQVGAWASAQSRSLADRATLEAAVAAIEARFAGVEALPRPPYWGGYLLRPSGFEFWQGRHSRLHDRIAFEADAAGSWRRQRLAP